MKDKVKIKREKIKRVEFNTFTHSELEKAFEKYNALCPSIEKNEYVGVRRIRKELSNIRRLCLKRRKEILDTYRDVKERTENLL